MTAYPAFFKPSSSGTLFRKTIPHGTLTIRSLDLSLDLDTIHEWVNREYARAFWQMQGSRHALRATYEGILAAPHAHSFMVLLDDVSVGQVDLYSVLADELAAHVEPALDNDCGLHLLMLPPKQSRKHLADEVLKAFVEYYFSFSAAGHLYCEPDSLNATANALALRAGFSFIRRLTLSSKTANLYVIKKY